MLRLAPLLVTFPPSHFPRVSMRQGRAHFTFLALEKAGSEITFGQKVKVMHSPNVRSPTIDSLTDATSERARRQGGVRAPGH